MRGNIGNVTQAQNTRYYECSSCGGTVGYDVYNSGHETARSLSSPRYCTLCGSPHIHLAVIS
jgi:hypothetical protein